MKKQHKNFSVWLQSFFIHWTVWTSKSSFVSLHFSSILAKANIFLGAKENWPFRLWISVPEELLMSSKSKDPNSGWWKTDWIGSEENRRKIPYFLPKLKEIVVGKSIRGKSFKNILFEFSRQKVNSRIYNPFLAQKLKYLRICNISILTQKLDRMLRVKYAFKLCLNFHAENQHYIHFY